MDQQINIWIMKNPVVLFLFLILIAVACNQTEPVSQFHTFTNTTWQRFDHLNFEFPVEDIEDNYDFTIIITHTAEFPADALSVNVVMNTPGGEERIRDHNLFLKDRDGIFIGYETDGIFNRIIKIREGMRFHEAGLVKFDIENLMTKLYTPGIIEFGIVMEVAKE